MNGYSAGTAFGKRCTFMLITVGRIQLPAGTGVDDRNTSLFAIFFFFTDHAIGTFCFFLCGCVGYE